MKIREIMKKIFAVKISYLINAVILSACLFLMCFGCNATTLPEEEDETFLFLEYLSSTSTESVSLETIRQWLDRLSISYRPEDVYPYPVKAGTPEWGALTEPERIESLQIPASVLAKISTEGLLQTCLESPFIITALYMHGGFQNGMEWLVENLNGLRSLIQRPDAPISFIGKFFVYLEDFEYGRISSMDLFFFELLLAQDAVVNKMNKAQEKTLVWFSLVFKNIQENNTEIFGEIHIDSRSLLFAKLLMKDPDFNDPVIREKLAVFTKWVHPLDQQTVDYLCDYVKNKYNVK